MSHNIHQERDEHQALHDGLQQAPTWISAVAFTAVATIRHVPIGKLPVKLYRIAASAIGVAIIAVTTLSLSTSSLAATPGVAYVTSADIGQTNVAGAAGWTKFPFSTLSSSSSGLAMTRSSTVSYGVATPIPASTGAAVADFAGATTFSSSSNLDVYPGITLFDANGHDDLIFPVDPSLSLTDPANQWYPTNPVGALNGPFSLAQLDSELSTNASLKDWTIRSFSLEPDAAVTIYTMIVNGQRFSFLPEPVVSAAPTTVITTDLAATGVTVTSSGFLPGEAIDYHMSDGDTGTAGNATLAGGLSFVYRSAAPAGRYTLTLVGSASAVSQSFEFTVTAPPVVAPPTQPEQTGLDGTTLAATGADDSKLPIAAGVLLFGGLALTIVARRKRRSA